MKKIVVQCAIEHENKFLIIKRPKGKHAGGLLSFPGGKAEEQDERGDMLRNAVKREIFEETGLILEDQLDYITSSSFLGSDRIKYLNCVFHCVLKKTSLSINACEREVPKYYWMNQAEINQSNNSPEWLKGYINIIMQNTQPV